MFGTLIRLLLVLNLSPLVGTWRLNFDKSDFASGPPPYSRVICRIAPSAEDGLRVIYDMIGTRGGVTHWEWTGHVDGKDYALEGVEEVVTNAYSRIDDHTYTVVAKLDGRATSTTPSVSECPGRAAGRCDPGTETRCE